MIRFTSFSFFLGGLVAASLIVGTPAVAQQNNSNQADVLLPVKKAKKATSPAKAPSTKVTGAKVSNVKVAGAKVTSVAKAKTADKKPAATEKADTNNADKPLLAGTYGDWGAYQSSAGKAKVCYALSQPKSRQPAGLQRDPAFMFITRRPSGGVSNEISVDMGFPLKDNASGAIAEVGTDKFELVAKGTYVWVKNLADEPKLLDAMLNGANLVVKAPSKKGNVTTDSYSLNGLKKAWERVKKDCP